MALAEATENAQSCRMAPSSQHRQRPQAQGPGPAPKAFRLHKLKHWTNLVLNKNKPGSSSTPRQQPLNQFPYPSTPSPRLLEPHRSPGPAGSLLQGPCLADHRGDGPQHGCPHRAPSHREGSSSSRRKTPVGGDTVWLLPARGTWPHCLWGLLVTGCLSYSRRGTVTTHT